MLCLLYSPLSQKIASAYFTTYIRELPFFFFFHKLVVSGSLTLGRTRKFIPPLWYKGEGGAGWIEPIPAVFDMLQYFETIVPLVKSL